MRPKTPFRSRPQNGFTLVELLTVVAIIGLLSAVAVPAMARYMRNYRIRGAAQQVAGEIGAARTKAIARNTNLGVLFVTLSSSTYRWVIQDDPTVPGIQQSFTTLIATPAQVGPLQTLPAGVVFDSTGATTLAVGFNRLGGQCSPGTRGCGSLAGAPATNYVMVDGAGQATVTLLQPDTGLRRTVTVTPGGRVLAQP
jgi:prepilin-type N-terminal cleavage/methylation domain-containing protein